GREYAQNDYGTVYRTRLQALPAGRHEALPQGGALHHEVHPRPASFAAGAAGHVTAPAANGVCAAVAREAEGAPDLRRAGGAVPPALRRGGAPRRLDG